MLKGAEFSVCKKGEGNSKEWSIFGEGFLVFVCCMLVCCPDSAIISCKENGYFMIGESKVFFEVFADAFECA